MDNKRKATGAAGADIDGDGDDRASKRRKVPGVSKHRGAFQWSQGSKSSHTFLIRAQRWFGLCASRMHALFDFCASFFLSISYPL